LTGIRPEILNYLNTARIYAVVRALQRQAVPRALILLEPFKPLSLETIKAQIANVIGAAAMCLNTQTLSQCNRVNPTPVAINPRGDEREMKL
jgi:hypothetical protein